MIGKIKLCQRETMNNLNRDELISLAVELDLPSLLNFCKMNKRTNDKICNNEIFWKTKLNKDFPNFVNRQNSYKKQYLFLNKILTRKRFEDILKKPSIASELMGFDNEIFLDLYDLLYNMDSEHNFGVIRINFDRYDDEGEDISLPEIVNEYYVLESILSENDYKEGEIGRRRSLINEIKEGNFHDILAEKWEENDFMQQKYKTVNDYINSISTLESRYQEFINEKNFNDVRKDIKKYQSNIADDIEDALYDEDQIEFLQILHDAIKSRKLSIFDPINYDLMIEKLHTY